LFSHVNPYPYSMAICIIPARGNSKRLPGKNLLSFHGKPLVQIAVETAISAGCFSKVIVSSEDSNVLAATEGIAGVINSRRPEILSGDDIRADDVVRWEISRIPDQSDSVICCLLPTTPLLSPRVLADAASKYTSGVLFGVIPTSETPFRSFTQEPGSTKLNALYPEMLNLQSQGYPQTVVDAGQFYFARAQIWDQNYSITACAEAHGFMLDPKLAIDINYPADWDKLIQHS
jgi:pseudaminic acid cytidylyltransferase